MQVQSALSRRAKEVTVAKLVDGLENSIAVFGVKFNKVSVSILGTSLQPHAIGNPAVVVSHRLTNACR